MNIYDKINIIDKRLNTYNINLVEHKRILIEEFDNLQEGDQEVIKDQINQIQSKIAVLIKIKQELLNI